MNAYLAALTLAALPAAGNFVGGVLSEAVQVSQRTLSLALHAAAGIVLAVVGIELMPQALEAEPPWIVLLAFVAGGGFFIGIDHLIGLVKSRFGDTTTSAAPWSIYIGVAVDLFSDGIMIGTGSTIAMSLALLLALGQVPADIPEGFATIATFKKQNIPRRIRLVLAASFAIPIVLGTTIGYWAVRGQPALVKLALLAFTAGILLTVVVEEMVSEAHEGDEARSAALMLVGGFALFALIATYVE